MLMRYFVVALLAVFFLGLSPLAAQIQGTPEVRTAGAELDSLRKLEEEGRDTVIFNSTYIRYTNLSLLKDSTQTEPLDTTLHRFHNYNPLITPENPSANLG